jgi:predicted aminopeptidase
MGRRAVGCLDDLPPSPVRSLILAAAAFLSQSCFSGRYLAQAARGQFEIVSAARPITDVIADHDVPAKVRRLLAAVDTIKSYGRAHGLRPTASYERYADLRRPAAVWVVQGCAPLSFDVKRWAFPAVGSVPYLGFFREDAARHYAETLAAQEALDVDVRTASAFSTLGWFHDPVLSTMIESGDEALGHLANVVLHESVHATLYVKDQSAFNESLASFVADRLTASWLESAVGRDAPEARAWIAGQARDRARVARLHRTYVELDGVFRSASDEAAKRAEKARILAEAQSELRLRRPLNNAVLAGYRTYDTGIPAFERLLAACSGSWPRLFRTLGALADSGFVRPQEEEFDAEIDRVTHGGCAG